MDKFHESSDNNKKAPSFCSRPPPTQTADNVLIIRRFIEFDKVFIGENWLLFYSNFISHWPPNWKTFIVEMPWMASKSVFKFGCLWLFLLIAVIELVEVGFWNYYGDKALWDFELHRTLFSLNDINNFTLCTNPTHTLPKQFLC